MFIFIFTTGGIGNNGAARLDYFKNVVAVPSVAKTGGALSFNNFTNGQLWLALITFLYGAPQVPKSRIVPPGWCAPLPRESCAEHALSAEMLIDGSQR